MHLSMHPTGIIMQQSLPKPAVQSHSYRKERLTKGIKYKKRIILI